MKGSKHRQPGVRKGGPPQRKLGTLQKGDRIADKFPKTDTTKLIADIARGVPIPIACAAVGISARSFYTWLDERPEFAQALAAEKQVVILEALDAIRSCSTKDSEFRNRTWLLETVYRDYFAPPDKGFHFTQNNLMLGDLDEARRILDEAKALPYRQKTVEACGGRNGLEEEAV